jgi:mono/diheme cytochrome c family protein
MSFTKFGLLLLLCYNIDICNAQNIVPWKAPEFADTLQNPLANDNPLNGKKVFMTICFVCHGEKGKGDGIASAQLKPKPANFTSDAIQKQTDGAIFWKLSTGRGAMVPFQKTITPTQRWQLVNYIRLLGKK